jgi:ATP-dependent DNA helicase RecG
MIIDLLRELNELDEHPTLEAKACSSGDLGDSVFETVCAFANEPDLGGGRIVLGVTRSLEDFFGGYEVIGVGDPDKLLKDIASGCATRFNHPVRPRAFTESHEGKTVVIVEIDELSPSQKPLYFAKHHLPRGAWRRIGSTDQRCTDEDLVLFYGNRQGDSYDLTILGNATIEDLDPEAIAHYRKLRAKVNPLAEELEWSDHDLLQSLNAIRRENGIWRPTLTGMLLFATRMAYRRELPAVRVDYIRVPGKEWVEDPEKRFSSTVDMRGPLLQIVDRAQAAVMDDLPKGFDLQEGQIQAETPTLPARVLREAIVNALMHRSYREHRPTQIIRYSNRIEIQNAGFSLKNEDQLGEPGSQLRNPNLAAVFHETNTAETKGSGIRVMREQMRAHGFSLPTFESDRANNSFTQRLPALRPDFPP